MIWKTILLVIATLALAILGSLGIAYVIREVFHLSQIILSLFCFIYGILLGNFALWVFHTLIKK